MVEMSDIDVVLKAIDKATENGWDKAEIWLDVMTNHVALPAMNNYIFKLIFSHDFAKALWGEELVCQNCGDFESKKVHDPYCSEQMFYYPNFHWHLQEMVIADDPIAYLKENI